MNSTEMLARFVIVAFVTAPTLGFLSPPSFLRFGSCSEVAVQQGLDLEKFAGRWFTFAKMPNEYDPGKFCINTQYSYHGDHMTSTQRGLYEDRSKQKLSTYLEVPDEPDPVLTVIASGVPNAPLKIIATDYENYACLYTCLGLVGVKAEFGIILTREPLPPPSVPQMCRDRFTNDTDIDVTEMELIEHGKRCPYWTRLGLQDKQTPEKNFPKKFPENRLRSSSLVQPDEATLVRDRHANSGRLLAAGLVLQSTSLVICLVLTLVVSC